MERKAVINDEQALDYLFIIDLTTLPAHKKNKNLSNFMQIGFTDTVGPQRSYVDRRNQFLFFLFSL